MCNTENETGIMYLLDKLLIKTSITHKGFLRVEVLMECLPDNRVAVDTDAHLLQ